MVFLGVYRAIYAYAPQSENELAIQEGDLLFVLEKSTDDDWWKAKKKAADDDEDEPEGLIPNNYVEEAQPLYQAKALYDYTKQTDEELSFTEDARLDVYDTTDEDWTLVGLNGEYGFAPAIYIEKAAGAVSAAPSAPAMPARPQAPARQPEPEPEPDFDDEFQSPPESPVLNPAANLAAIIAQKTGQASATTDRGLASPPLPQRPQYTPEESDEEGPPPLPNLPQRPPSQVSSPAVASFTSPRSPSPPGVRESYPHNREMHRDGYDEHEGLRSPGGFHMYNVSEMVSHMGKNKKMPTTLGINVGRGVIMISPEKSRDGPQQEWTAEKLTHYSIEGKHVFVELVRPSKSIDFHAGAKDTAQEIVAKLGELAGAFRAEGFREVIAAASGSGPGGQKKGHMLYEFMAQGDDEVTVAVGDEVIVLDDTKSDEWWMVRRLKNGKEGVVPSSYVEVTGTAPAATSSYNGVNAGRSTVEQNRLEEERLTREATKSHRKRDSGSRPAEVGPGVQLPERHSSLVKDSDSRHAQRSKRESKSNDKSSKPKPDASKVRTWTDRSGTFKVEAEFIGLKDGKIHLHKLNGVKIAVPVAKMAVEDLEYVEKVTGVSLDEDKPLSDIKRRNTQRHKEKDSSREQKKKSGVSFANDKSDYDWFDFFLQAGCNPQICERYANAFSRDQMGEEVLPDVDPHLLRTLGLKEGDILRVMKFLDKKFGRTGQRNVSFGASQAVGDEKDPDAIEPVNGSGGLFSGQGGALRNNTRKGRPAPPVQTNDVVDPDAFKQKTDDTENKALHAEAAPTPLANTSARTHTVSGFDDDAWDVKPSKTPAAAAAAAPAATPSPAPQAAALTPAPAPAPAAPALTGSMNELSLLSPPLQPTPAPQPTPQPAAQPAAPPQQPARTGADPSFFDKLAAPAPPRERPQAPQQTGGSLIAPPPARAASAPGFNPQQPGGFGLPPLQPQLTGYRALQGQSLQDLNQQRLQQQQFSQMQPQMTGFPQQQQPGFQPMMPQPTGFTQFQQQQPQQTGFPQFQQQPTGFQPSVQQQFINGQATGSPFADPPRAPFQPTPSRLQSSLSPQSTLYPQQTGFMQPQPTGFMQQPQQQQFPQQLQPQQTGFGGLPPALQPQLTGVNGFGQQNGFGQPAPTLPPMPPMPTGFAQPLVPQKTGPAPPVRFGTQPANKLTPQPTGRANLRNATPQNPFGF